MESLNQTVRFGMVRRREMGTYAPDIHQLLPHGRRELTAVVSGD